MKYLLSVIALILILLSCIGKTDKIDNLDTFAKAYGYVKYFHPSNESASVDWNTFAAYGTEEVLNCQSQEEVLSTLNNLFQPIGPGIKFTSKPQHYDLISITPNDTSGYKPTYWQHKGVTVGMTNNAYTPYAAYSSIRVNQYTNIDESDDLGYISRSIDVSPHIGKEIRYTGWTKLSPQSKGTGHLLMKIRDDNNNNLFFENMYTNPITSTEWKRNDIVTTVGKDASELILGSFLSGKGTMYIDHVQLHYNKDGEWVEIPLDNNDFETASIDPTYQTMGWRGSNVGYRMSIDETQAYQGDKCAVIKFNGKSRKVLGESIMDKSPSFGEVIEKKIGENIYCQIPLNLYGNEEHTYPKSSTIEALHDRLASTDYKPEDLALRIGNVINVHNVFQHFYPYFDEVDVDWNQEFRSALERSFTDQTANDHLITLEKFTATLDDGHVYAYGQDRTRYYAPPIRWEWIEDKLVIVHISDDQLDLNIGDIVTEIDDVTTHEYFEEVNSRISAATKGYLNHSAYRTSLLGTQGSDMNIKVNSNTYILKRDNPLDYRFSGIEIQKYDHLILDNNIHYINMSTIEMSKIDSLLSELDNAKGIICDLRGYPNSNHGILSHLIQANVNPNSWMHIPQTIYPDQENRVGYASEGWELEAKTPYLGDNNVIFLIDGRAISYAESVMINIKGLDMATIVGQPTAGTNGNINPFTILGGYNLSWTGMKVTHIDGSQFHGIGVLPDVYVEKTIAGLKEGRDEYVDKAVELIMAR